MSVRALPSQEVTEPELKAKKDALKGLTVAKLASYDDFLTDALVDRVSTRLEAWVIRESGS